MNELSIKLKEANFNVIYYLYNTYSSDFKMEIFFSIIELLQNFGLIMNSLVYKNFNLYRLLLFGKNQNFCIISVIFLNISDFFIIFMIIKICLLLVLNCFVVLFY